MMRVMTALLVTMVASCSGGSPPANGTGTTGTDSTNATTAGTTIAALTGDVVTGTVTTVEAVTGTGTSGETGAGAVTSGETGSAGATTGSTGDPAGCGPLDEAACEARDDCVIRKGPSCPGCEDVVFQACTSVEIGVCDRAESACPGLASCADPEGAACAACVADPEVCPDATYPPREDAPHILPYPTGTTRNVRQGNCNAANSHNDGESFAYDFEMPIGSPIIASRGGTVLAVIEAFTDEQHAIDQGNLVAIDHGDRTYAKYGHITFEGALVEVGETVEQGQVIAMSGNSGLSQGPHLHYAVKECPPDVPIGSATCVSIPVSFRNTIPHPEGLVGSPTSQIGGGSWYPACAWVPAP